METKTTASSTHTGGPSTAAPLHHCVESSPPSLAAPSNRTGFRGWLRTSTGIFSGAVTLVAGLLSIIFLLVPSLRPAPPPSAFGATLFDPKIETEVELGAYYGRIGQQAPASLSAEDLSQPGVIVSFTIVLEGYAGQECRLRWSALDATTSRRVAETWLVDQPGWPSGVFLPVAARDQGSGEVFVPNPPRAGDYVVRLELFDPEGTRIATLDSPVFSVVETAMPAPAGLPSTTPPG